MKRTYQPSKIVRKRRHGFRSRMSTKAVENFCPGDELKAVKDFLHKTSMIKLESLKKSSHFQRVLKHRVINSELFTIYRTKNFINKTKENKKLYISFVMKKKIGNAVKRNRIKRKLKFIVHKLIKNKKYY